MKHGHMLIFFNDTSTLVCSDSEAAILAFCLCIKLHYHGCPSEEKKRKFLSYLFYLCSGLFESVYTVCICMCVRKCVDV